MRISIKFIAYFPLLNFDLRWLGCDQLTRSIGAYDEKQDSSYLVPATVVCGGILLVAGLYGLRKLRKK